MDSAVSPLPRPAGHSDAPRPAARLQVARAAAASASALSRAVRLGSGSSIGGRVALAVHPQALAQLGRGRVLACVSGTNGKTTTTRLLTAALRRTHHVLSNSSGANMPSGLVGLLGQDLGRPAVLEVDELHLEATMSAVRPRIAVLLNLTRDQLDRSAEVSRPAAAWRRALAGTGIGVVANCDDPRVVWAARESDTVIWVSVGWSWAADGKVCPNCGHPLHHGRGGRPDGAADWACSMCGLRRPNPDASVIGDELVLSDGSVARLALRLPGRANQANAALAVMAAGQLGVPLVEGLAAMREVGEIEGRYAERSIVGRRCRLLLAKNPAGWAATMDLVGANGRPLLLSVNAADQDGRDTSWLYDVPFEQVRGRPVIVTGAAGVDLSLRLGYAGVLHRHVVDKRQAIRAIGVQAEQYGRSNDPIEVIGDYSSFQQLRRLAATTW